MSSNGISRLSIPAEDEVDDRLKPMFDFDRKQHGGKVDNWLRAVSLSPATLLRASNFLGPMFDPQVGELSLAERELIAVIVSIENGCAYCEAHHLQNLAKAMGDPRRAQRFALNYRYVNDITEREKVLADMAVKLSRDAREFCDEDIERMRAAGLSDRGILEALEIASAFNYSTKLTIALHVYPQDGLFDLEG